jgi:gluconokinase
MTAPLFSNALYKFARRTSHAYFDVPFAMTNEQFPRSPYDAVRGLVYFPRMLDKIRLREAGKLPLVYHEHLGSGFDGRCLHLLGVNYEDVKQRVFAGDSDEAVLDWCLAHGRKPDEEDIETWSGFMTKRGWRDEASDRVTFRLKEAGLEARDRACVTMFDFIDIDEGRTPPDFRKWEPPRLA